MTWHNSSNGQATLESERVQLSLLHQDLNPSQRFNIFDSKSRLHDLWLLLLVILVSPDLLSKDLKTIRRLRHVQHSSLLLCILSSYSSGKCLQSMAVLSLCAHAFR